MKKTWIIIIAVIAVIAVYGISSYNSMVSQEEAVGTAWSNVENQYQRRADLIPNLDMQHTKRKRSTLWCLLVPKQPRQR